MVHASYTLPVPEIYNNEKKNHDVNNYQNNETVPPPEDTTDFIKTRFVFLILGMLGIAILFIVRVNLSVAIVAMINNTALDLETLIEEENEYMTYDVCPGELTSEGEIAQDGEFQWSEEYQGFILSGYFYGYALGQLPGGILAEKLGGKLVFGLGTFLSAALTVISPFCAWVSGDLFFAIRLIEGLAGSVTFPAIQYMVANWSPPAERSKFSMIFSGGYLGIVICMPISGLLCNWKTVGGGWPMVFYVFGAIGVIWYIPWLFLVYETPSTHPRISKEERRYIEHAIGSGVTRKKLPIPWKKVLTCPPLWACATIHLGIGWVFYILLTCLPTYMQHVLRYKIDDNAALSTIPYITAGLFGVACSPLLEYITKSKIVSRLTGFKILIAIASVGPAITLFIIPAIGCQNTWIIILLAINGLCLGAQYTGIFTNLLDLAPNFSGTMLGISNTFCNGAGIMAPLAVGFITNNNQTMTRWNYVFYISAVISLVTFVIYLLLCSDKEQPWNNPQEDTEKQIQETIKKRTSETSNGYVNTAYEKD